MWTLRWGSKRPVERGTSEYVDGPLNYSHANLEATITKPVALAVQIFHRVLTINPETKYSNGILKQIIVQELYWSTPLKKPENSHWSLKIKVSQSS